MLTLPEELMLLALDDEKGSVLSTCSIALPYGLAGAVVMELGRRKRIEMEGEHLKAGDASSTGDEILDEALANLAGAEKPHKARYWIGLPEKLVRGLQDRLLRRLVEKGVLKKEEHRFLWLVPYSRYPARDGAPERTIRHELRDVVLHGHEADEHTALLLCLVHACQLAREVFPREHAKEIAEKLKEFAEGDRVAEAVSENVTAATMAIISSTVASSVATSVIITQAQ